MDPSYHALLHHIDAQQIGAQGKTLQYVDSASMDIMDVPSNKSLLAEGKQPYFTLDWLSARMCTEVNGELVLAYKTGRA